MKAEENRTDFTSGKGKLAKDMTTQSELKEKLKHLTEENKRLKGDNEILKIMGSADRKKYNDLIDRARVLYKKYPRKMVYRHLLVENLFGKDELNPKKDETK